MVHIQDRVILARAIIQRNGLDSCLLEILCGYTYVGIHQKSAPCLVEFPAGWSFQGISVQDRDIDGLLFFDDGIPYRCWSQSASALTHVVVLSLTHCR